jgi:hemophore-related protein
MKRMTIIAGGAATAILAGTLLAVPALAEGGSSSASSSTAAQGPLTATEKDAIDGFLADHLGLAHALAGRAEAWAAFLKAHPDIATEIAKVKTLPAGERRAEVKKWLSDNPDARTAIRDWRSAIRGQRQDQRKARRDQRQARRGDAGTASSTSSSV